MPPSSAAHVVVVGSINEDQTLRVRSLPNGGETVVAYGSSRASGGKGANQAVASAVCAAVPTTMIAAVGDDGAGRRMIANLEAHGVRSATRIVTGVVTGNATIVVDDAAENLIVIIAGANEHISLESRDSQEALSTASVLLLQLETPPETSIAAANKAREANPLVTIMLNAAPVRQVPSALWESIDILIVNETEAAAFAGQPVGATAEKMIASLLSLVDECVITLGSEGCLFASRSRGTIRLAGTKVNAVDTTGAGDTFCGTFAGKTAQGYSRTDALVFASQAAALSVLERGAQGGMLPAEVIEQQLLEQSRVTP